MTRQEIERTAQRLIDRHGPDAPRVATQRAVDLAAQGDDEGQRAWRTVATRIGELRRSVVPFAIC
jgi:hypothetical protein